MSTVPVFAIGRIGLVEDTTVTYRPHPPWAYSSLLWDPVVIHSCGLWITHPKATVSFKGLSFEGLATVEDEHLRVTFAPRNVALIAGPHRNELRPQLAVLDGCHLSGEDFDLVVD